MSEVEETFKRISQHRGVKGVIISNYEGKVIRHDHKLAEITQISQYASLMTQLAAKARSSVRDLDPLNDLTFLRVRSKNYEIMVAPDKEFVLIVIQDPSDQTELPM